MRPTRTSTLVLVVLGVLFIVLSPIGQDGASGPSWIGDLGWYGFLACAALLILSGVSFLIARFRGRDRVTLR